MTPCPPAPTHWEICSRQLDRASLDPATRSASQRDRLRSTPGEPQLAVPSLKVGTLPDLSPWVTGLARGTEPRSACLYRPDSTSKQQGPRLRSLFSAGRTLFSSMATVLPFLTENFLPSQKAGCQGLESSGLQMNSPAQLNSFWPFVEVQKKPLITALRFQIKPLASLPCLSPSAKPSAGAGRSPHVERSHQAGSSPRPFSHLCSALSAANQTMWTAQQAQAATCAGPGPARCCQEGLQRLTLTPCPPARAPSLRWCLWS